MVYNERRHFVRNKRISETMVLWKLRRNVRPLEDILKEKFLFGPYMSLKKSNKTESALATGIFLIFTSTCFTIYFMNETAVRPIPIFNHI